MLSVVPYEIPFDIAYNLWWADTRVDWAGLGLSKTGRDVMKKTSYPCYPINLSDPFLITSKILLGLNRCLSVPFFLNLKITTASPHKTIEIFGEQEATFLILLGGDLNQFVDQMEIRIIL